MKAKDNIKKAVAQIKKLAAQEAVEFNSDSDASPRVPHKKNARAGVLLDRNQHGDKTPKHKCYWCYCVLCKKATMPDRKYKSHSSQNCL